MAFNIRTGSGSDRPEAQLEIARMLNDMKEAPVEFGAGLW